MSSRSSNSAASGGMKSLTYTQVAQCAVLVVAYVVPAALVFQAGPGGDEVVGGGSLFLGSAANLAHQEHTFRNWVIFEEFQ